MGKPLDDPAADRFNRGVTRLLAGSARITGEWGGWAEAQWHLPSSSWRAACREFQSRVAAWATPSRPAPETPRRQLARLAIRLLRTGTTAGELLRQLDAANATLHEPVTSSTVGEVAIWAASAVREDRRHAR